MKLKKNQLVRFVQDIDCRDTSGPFIAKGLWEEFWSAAGLKI